jgi:LDH2 family malate/lactate/ureidoglycolate dehydrogenase
MARLTGLVKATPPAPGFDEVLIPGELEARTADDARALGIELEQRTIALLHELGAAESVAFPAALA